MHAVWTFAISVMALGNLVVIQHPHRGNPWHNVGVTMVCLNVIGGILLA